MKKISFNLILSAALTLITSLSLQANESDLTTQTSATTAAAAYEAPKWKTSLMSYYYEMQGRKAADNQEYDFNNLNMRLDLINLNYTLSQNWSFNILLQHYEFYTETLFPKSKGTAFYQSFDRTEGAGDTYLSLMTPLVFKNSWLVLGEFGVSVPTGTINNKSNLPGLQAYNLAYNAQHGSGTYDLLASATALNIQVDSQFGSRLSGTIRTGRNSNDYTLGNMYRLDSWYDYNTSYGITPRLVGYYRYKEAIHNVDKTRGRILGDEFYYNPQSNWDISAALKYQHSFTNLISASAELGVPVAQNSINVDNSNIVTKYYGAVTLNGSF